MYSSDKNLRTVVAAGIAVILLMIGMSIAVNRSGEKETEAKSGEFADMRYPYSQLTAKEKKLYTTLYEGIAAFKTQINLPETYTAEEYKKVYLLAATQEPEFFYLDNTYETTDQMESTRLYYATDQQTAEEMQKKMEAAADRILSGVSPVLSEEQKVLRIHDLICQNCIYLEGPHGNDAYGCLVEGMAQCEGYAKAFLYVTRRAGIEAMCVPGETDAGEAHIWNKVKLGGHYYNIDLTWDDDENYNGETAHNCYAVPDGLFGDHKADNSMFMPPPSADASKSYYAMYGMVLNDVSRLPEMIRLWNGQRPGRVLEFSCPGSYAFEQAKEALKSNSDVQAALFDATGSVSPRMFADKTRYTIIILT